MKFSLRPVPQGHFYDKVTCEHYHWTGLQSSASWPEPIGNHEFIVYAEDRNEPGIGVYGLMQFFPAFYNPFSIEYTYEYYTPEYINKKSMCNFEHVWNNVKCYSAVLFPESGIIMAQKNLSYHVVVRYHNNMPWTSNPKNTKIVRWPLA